MGLAPVRLEIHTADARRDEGGIPRETAGRGGVGLGGWRLASRQTQSGPFTFLFKIYCPNTIKSSNAMKHDSTLTLAPPTPDHTQHVCSVLAGGQCDSVTVSV